MTNVHRFWNGDHTVFTTHITHGRRPILVDNINFLREAIDVAVDRGGLSLLAWVILPDRMHLLLGGDGAAISDGIKRMKLSFSARYRKRYGLTGGRVWQYRFWDRIIRDAEDLNRHLDYIHHNPVKHGVVASPFDWPHSSIHEFCRQGLYTRDWCEAESSFKDGEYGE